jgi:hypothetical protein
MPTSGQFVVGELVTASDANSLFVRGYRNRIINGAFVINQRGYTSGTNLASGSYGFDRWKSGFTNTALTFTAGSQSTTVTISTSGVLQQIVERENMPAGTYVLSWSGTATGRVYNSGGTPPGYAASPVTVTLDGLANVVVEFTASGGTKTLGTVQLEGGTVFSPFEYRHRSEEILLCYRYLMATGGAQGHLLFTRGVDARPNIFIPLSVPLRASPTPSYTGTVGVTNYWSGIGSVSGTIGLTTWEPDMAGVFFNTWSGLSAGTYYMANLSAATIFLSSEL